MWSSSHNAPTRIKSFRVNAKEAIAGVGYTQVGRAMQSLNIDVICANTPAAKGSVERAHQTLQDRLVKELRLRGICDREAGNVPLDEFREDYNRRFARVPRHNNGAHCQLLPQDDLRRIFTWQEQRRLTNNLTLHYKRVPYVIDNTPTADNPVATHRCTPAGIVENKALGHTLRIIHDRGRARTGA